MFRIRRFIRRNFPPIPEPKAKKWNRRLRFIYLFCSWNAFGLLFYHHFYSEKKSADGTDLHESLALGWAKILHLDNAQVLTIKGVSSVKKSMITNYVQENVVEDEEEVATKPETLSQ